MPNERNRAIVTGSSSGIGKAIADALLSDRWNVIGFDVASFSIAESRAVIEAAREFIRRLEPEDSVGVYAFPIGPKFRPSADHGAIMGRIDSIVGSRESLHNSHGLSGVDVMDRIGKHLLDARFPL